MKEFQPQVSQSLTFLKNVETVSFYHNKEKVGSVSIVNAVQIRAMREVINSAIIGGSAISCGGKFNILQERPGDSEVQSYFVQQQHFDLRTLDIGNELKQWAADEKAVSWISLAAPLDRLPSEGRIFVTLPLPVPLENTRVNVHSMFALKRDRRSVWTDNDSPGPFKLNEVLWNNLLVKTLMPRVWTDLLAELAQLKPSVYEYFPLVSVGPLFNNLTRDVLQRILDRKVLIWHTNDSYLALDQGFLVVEDHGPQFLSCLKGLKVPLLTGIPATIVQLIRHSPYPHQILSPSALRNWFRGRLVASSITEATAMMFLEYMSSDEQMDQLFDLPLFPCRNGSLISLKKIPSGAKFNDKVYVGTYDEGALFDENADRFLCLDHVPQQVTARIESHITSMSASLNLERFGISSFERYAHDVLFGLKLSKPKDSEISAGGLDFGWLQRLWKWLDSKPVNMVAAVVQRLWLIPLEGNMLRQVNPTGLHLTLDPSPFSTAANRRYISY